MPIEELNFTDLYPFINSLNVSMKGYLNIQTFLSGKCKIKKS